MVRRFFFVISLVWISFYILFFRIVFIRIISVNVMSIVRFILIVIAFIFVVRIFFLCPVFIFCSYGITGIIILIILLFLLNLVGILFFILIGLILFSICLIFGIRVFVIPFFFFTGDFGIIILRLFLFICGPFFPRKNPLFSLFSLSTFFSVPSVFLSASLSGSFSASTLLSGFWPSLSADASFDCCSSLSAFSDSVLFSASALSVFSSSWSALSAFSLTISSTIPFRSTFINSFPTRNPRISAKAEVSRQFFSYRLSHHQSQLIDQVFYYFP